MLRRMMNAFIKGNVGVMLKTVVKENAMSPNKEIESIVAIL